MKNYKKNYNSKSLFLYNVILYSLTTIITCSFVSYSLWFPATEYLVSTCLPIIWSFSFLSPKFLFVVGNIIVIVLIKEYSKKQGSNAISPATEIYDEYVARSRRGYTSRKAPAAQSNYVHIANKIRPAPAEEKAVESTLSHAQERKEMKISTTVAENENLQQEKIKEKGKEIPVPCDQDLNPRAEGGPDSSPREILGISGRSYRADSKYCKEAQSGIVTRETREKEENHYNDIPREELNRRVEAYIARVNRKRLLEAKSLVCSRY